MSEHIVKILSTQPVTHNVKRFTLERPKDYTFIPGQATDVSVNLPDWKNELRPFTFTGLTDWETLEFTIKIYSDHNGVTNQLGKTEAESKLILHDVFGAIQYNGPGTFIAGGAGVTPFIAILRDLFRKNKIKGNKLIFSNRTTKDIILKDEFEKMLGNDFINVLTDEDSSHPLYGRINRDYVMTHITNYSQHFYVCGPDEFVKSITDVLEELGAKPDAIVFEK